MLDLSPSIFVWREETVRTGLDAFHRSAVDKADELYGQVDELLHQLTLLSNQRERALGVLQELEAQEDGLRQVGTTCRGVCPALGLS